MLRLPRNLRVIAVQLDSIVEEGPELEHKGLASASVQRLARLTAKLSMSSASSSSTGSMNSSRARPGMRQQKGACSISLFLGQQRFHSGRRKSCHACVEAFAKGICACLMFAVAAWNAIPLKRLKILMGPSGSSRMLPSAL